MRYKLILAVEDEYADEELCDYTLPVTPGEHKLDTILLDSGRTAIELVAKATRR